MLQQRTSDNSTLCRDDPGPSQSEPDPVPYFLESGGKMGAMMREHNWTNTSMGQPASWPPCLRTAVSMMLNSSFPMFIWWQRDTLTNLYNDAYLEIMNGKHPHGFAQPARDTWQEIWPQLEPLVTKVFDAGLPVHKQDMELQVMRRGQRQTAYFTFSYSPIRNDSAEVLGLFCTVSETTNAVTSRRQLAEYEAKLLESERRFRALADTAPMFIAMADETGNAVYFNKTWLDFTGKQLNEMTGLQWLSVLHPEDAPRFERDFKAAFAKHAAINREYRFRRADGEYRWMLAVGAPRFTPDGRFIGYFGTYTDFHDLKQAQLAVQANEERFRTLANNIAQLAWMSDKNGKITWFNQRWYDYTGQNPQENTATGTSHLLHPDEKAHVRASYEHSMKNGIVWEETFRIRSHDGHYRWFLTRAVPIRDANGQIQQWLGTNTDVTELRIANQRRVELEHIAAALQSEQTQLLAINQAKDEFISLASHQLRTPATGVKQYLGMLLGEFAGKMTDAQRDLVQHAYDSNDRQLSVVSDLLSVAQADAGKMILQRQQVDLVELIYNIIDEQTSKFVERQQLVKFRHAAKDCFVSVDRGRMRMVLENLVDNASKYTPTGKKITISLTHPRRSAVRVAIRDQGVGIAPEHLTTIFGKFTRVDNPLSEIVGGSGLGLYLVKKIVELHDGKINVVSNLGKGSSFIVTLPMPK